MQKSFLSQIRCFLIDMDGTFYLGEKLLPGALDFMQTITEQNFQYLFLTNNSSKNSYQYAQKIRRMGFDVSEERVFTSGDAAAIYLKQHFSNATIHVLGTNALIETLTENELNLSSLNPDIALLGYDTNLTFENLRLFCDTIRSGVPYVATHPDINCPTENGYMPDVGAFIELIAASTGRRPDIIIGKPFKHIVEAIKLKTGLPLEQIAMIGDRLYTDIALGRTGIKTILVLSGETVLNDIKSGEFKPDLICDNLAELNSILKKDITLIRSG